MDFTVIIPQNLYEINVLTLVQNITYNLVTAAFSAKMVKNQIARILPTLQKNKAPAAEGRGRGRGTQQLGGYCGLVKVRNKSGLEVDLGVVVAALQQLLHLFLAGLARVGTGAGVGNRVLGDFRQSLKEDILRHEALLCGVGVGVSDVRA